MELPGHLAHADGRPLAGDGVAADLAGALPELEGVVEGHPGAGDAGRCPDPRQTPPGGGNPE